MVQLNNSWFHHIHISPSQRITAALCIEPLEHERNDHAPEFGMDASWHPEWSFDSMVSKGFHDCTLVSYERNWEIG